MWKVIEEKEEWLEVDPETMKPEGGLKSVPAITLRFWKENSLAPGQGKTRTIQYSLQNESFNEHWEIIYDW